MISKNQKGFSLAELLIVLSIIGVVAGLTIPSLIRTTPDQEKMMVKKAYYTLEQTVANLINDTNFYPYDDSADESTYGFRNLSPASGCGCKRVGENGCTALIHNKKFSCLFAQQLNTIAEEHCDGSDDQRFNCFITGTDGIYWYIDYDTCSFPVGGLSCFVVFDVNGKGRGTDCMSFGDNDGNNLPKKCENGQIPDSFGFRISNTGKITISNSSEQELLRNYLQSTDPRQNR